MGVDNPRWGVIGVIFTLITAITGIVITIISIADPQTRSVGIVIFLISLALLAFFYFKLRAFKEITFQVISNTKVLSVVEGPEVKGRVKILLDDKPVKDIHMMVFRLWNSGSMPIQRNDFDNNANLTIDFDNETEVLEAEVIEATSGSLKKEASALLKIEHSSVMLEPLLLNNKDSITFKFLVTKANKSPEVNLENTRLVGVNKRNWDLSIEAKLDKNLKSSSFYFGIFSGCITSSIGALLILGFSIIPVFLLNQAFPLLFMDKKESFTNYGLTIWFATAFIIYLFVYFLGKRKNKKKGRAKHA